MQNKSLTGLSIVCLSNALQQIGQKILFAAQCSVIAFIICNLSFFGIFAAIG